ncbi:5'-methylthioadenosine/S-adenosylhomocysteine nucleosidase [Spiroplasma sp. DGKH1]|uniref:5'-methylthioadenosine/S-adenosylhomocysteine nucleosidase n=1 Tax=Spiroplasma sp. DGKH1 TaxID=3050074 RepID=UPI0034C65A38
MNLVIGAMQEELQVLLDTIKPSEIIKYDHIKLFQKGTWLFAISQIGQVNAAIALTTLINDYAIKKIYNIGTVGSLKPEYKIFELLIVEKALYTYADASEFGYQKGQIPQEPPFFTSDPQLISQITKDDENLHKVVLGTSDIFIDQQHHFEYLQANFNNLIDIVDMEGTAFFQTAYKFNIPILSIKVISDYLHNPTASTSQFKENLKYASIIIKDFILQLMQI